MKSHLSSDVHIENTDLGNQHEIELRRGDRFAFGENWLRFLERFSEERLEAARRSLQEMIGLSSLAGLRFLDIGSGSGLFSLAARTMGASVHSFDFDPMSVACTAELRRRYASADDEWLVEHGSILDDAYLHRIGRFDIVYSWGVLHHTGQMWSAIHNAAGRVAPGGRFFIALYNDQGRKSMAWLRVKRAYNALPTGLRWIVLTPSFAWLWGPAMCRDLLIGRPMRTWRLYDGGVRGMTPWRDFVDWVGGLPFEVATPHDVFDFCRQRGFTLERMKTQQGLGCNEFVFRLSGEAQEPVSTR